MKWRILEEAQNKMVDELLESVGRFEAKRMAGLFFSVVKIDEKSVTEYIYDKARESG